MKKSQEPKYDVNEFGHIYNRATSKVIPDDEPIFILRAKDHNAEAALAFYRTLCSNKEHRGVIGKRISDFNDFKLANQKLMKEPDSPTGI